MTMILPPTLPPNDGAARARVLHARAQAGRGRPTTRLTGQATGSPSNPQARTSNPRRKPLFILHHPGPRGRRARRGGGSSLGRTIASALGGTMGLILLMLVGGGAGTALAAWNYFTYDLPSVDQIHVSTFQSTKIYDRHGGLLWEVYDPQEGKRTYRTIDQIPVNLLDATLAAEDPTFRSNSGVDPLGIVRAVYINLTGRGSSGASTITMQLVRTVILPEKDEASARRKVREAILAQKLTERYGKDKILELYLNEIYYGSLAYGVDAAAEVYFGKAPAELNLAQCAYLAGLPQSPSYYGDPDNAADAKRRQEIVLGLMLRNNFITQDEYQAALVADVTPIRKAPTGPQEAPHFVNYVLNILRERYGDEMVDRGGLKVFTTIDLDYQHLGERVAREQVSALQADGASNAALLAMNPRTGEILAMVGSVDFNQPDWGQVNVTTAMRQPGSALKPIMYATALAQGYSAATMLHDIPLEFDGGTGEPPYKPTDYDNQYRGPVSMRLALANSLNIPAVEMLKQVGIRPMLQTATAMGIASLRDPARYGLSVVLGGGEVTLLELTNAYATFAAGGLHVPPIALLEVRQPDGTILEKFDPARARATALQRPALNAQHAYIITDILSDNEARTLLYGANSALRLSRPAAAKTGTTNDYKDSWTVGYSPDLVTGVWVGNNNGQAMAKVAGARGAGPIWHNFMESVLGDPEMERLLLQPGEAIPLEFPKPPNLVRVPVCVPSGLKPSAACPQTRSELFAAGTEPTEDDDLWKMYKIYIRGKEPLLAGPNCPPESIIDRPFLVLPAEYKDWAKVQPTPIGPPTKRADCAPPTPTPSATPEFTPTPVPGIGPIVMPTPLPNNPTPVEGDDFPGVQASISAPRPGSGLGGEVTISGSAAAPDFDYYQLAWGAGVAPATWTALAEPQRGAVVSNILGTWNTANLAEGPYVLRLLVVGQKGEQRQVLVPVAIERSKPQVRLTAPQPGAHYTAGDQVVLGAEADGPQGVQGVEFYVDSVRVAVAYAAPYVAVWAATPGTHVISAQAYSPANASDKSAPVTITVGQAAPPPPNPALGFALAAPADNSTVSDPQVVIQPSLPAGSPVARVDFYVDGRPAASVARAPYAWTWTATAGRHTLLAIGYRAEGSEVGRATVTVYVPAP